MQTGAGEPHPPTHPPTCTTASPPLFVAGASAERRQALESFSPRQLRLMFVLQPWEKKMNYGEQVCTGVYAARGASRQAGCVLQPWEKKMNHAGGCSGG